MLLPALVLYFYVIISARNSLNHTDWLSTRTGAEPIFLKRRLKACFIPARGSAVYLNLLTLSEYGVLPGRTSDIYTTFTAAMIDPLPEKQREFLAVMGLADEFTVEMAQFITGDAQAGQTISRLTEQNAFVKRLPDGITYRFHHMMKECAEHSFLALSAETQKFYWARFGLWYETRKYSVNGKTYRYSSRQSVSSKRDVGKQVVGYYKPDRPNLITENRPRKPVFGGFLYFYGAVICLFFGIMSFTGM